ncbi:MAG: prepilin-type N-terminal cleavage/methylation domain-containing protein [Phycisphaerales bacterium]
MRHRGFTLVEAMAVVVVLLALVAITAPVLGQPRRAARLQTSQDNLRFWGIAAGTYTMDYAGLMPAYSWRPGETYHVEGTGDVFINGTWQDAQNWQETNLLRRLTGRSTGPDKIRRSSNIYPHRRRTHLVMVDHMGLSPTDRRAADPQDRNQLVWQRDPLGFEEHGPWPEATTGFEDQFGSFPVIQRWPYSSSYQVTIASFTLDRSGIAGLSTIGPVAYSCNVFLTGTAPLGNRHDIEVAFPSGKVFMFEWHDRHSASQDLWYAYPQARPNRLMFDGSVQDRPSSEGGEGFDPRDPNDPEPFLYRYTPLTTDPQEVGDPEALYPVGIRFTRDGLAGIDYTP